MSTTFVTLPRELAINGVTHVQQWRTRRYVVMQNYTNQVPSGQPFIGPQIQGRSEWHVFAVILHQPGEELGNEVAVFSDITAAMDFVAKQEQFA
jgi:hypothetical protein